MFTSNTVVVNQTALKKSGLFLTAPITDYRISLVIRQSFLLPKQSQKLRSIL